MQVGCESRKRIRIVMALVALVILTLSSNPTNAANELREYRVGPVGVTLQEAFEGSRVDVTDPSIERLVAGDVWVTSGSRSRSEGPTTTLRPTGSVRGKDVDADGILDPLDNCLLRSNLRQIDADRDGFGNACDPDFDNDGVVSLVDARLLLEQLGGEVALDPPVGLPESVVPDPCAIPTERNPLCGGETPEVRIDEVIRKFVESVTDTVNDAGKVGPQDLPPIGLPTDPCVLTREALPFCDDVDVPDTVATEILERILDLNGDGRVGVEDVDVLELFAGQPPGPRNDSDGDGVDDLADRCPVSGASPEGTEQVLPGCTALDIVAAPEWPVVVFRNRAARLRSDVVTDGSSGTLDGCLAATVVDQVDAATAAIDDSRMLTGQGDFCTARDRATAGAEILTQTREYVDSIAALQFYLASLADIADDVRTIDLAASDSLVLAERLSDVASDAEDWISVLDALCVQDAPAVVGDGVVAKVEDARRRIVLQDGSEFVLASNVDVDGVVGPGQPVEVVGRKFDDWTGVAQEIVGVERGASTIPIPSNVDELVLGCASLRIAPYQKPPIGDASWELHDPRGYEGLVAGGDTHWIERGAGFAVVDDCALYGGVPPLVSGYYVRSVDLELQWDGGAKRRKLAVSLKPGDPPVPYPEDAPNGFGQIFLAVTEHRTFCRSVPSTRIGEDGTTSCNRPEVVRTSTYELGVLERFSYCRVSYEADVLTVNDQVADDFEPDWVSYVDSLLLPTGVAKTFSAEGYELCPDGQGDYTRSCAPEISAIYENHSFAVHNYDFYPVHPADPFVAALAEWWSGVDHAAGLRWPHISGTHDGLPWRYGCRLPTLVRDAVNLCTVEPHAYYRLPFAGGDPSWDQGQGNLSSGTHAGGYAYDMNAPCGTEIRAARGGIVEAVQESADVQTWDDCSSVTTCPTESSCSTTKGSANQIYIRHQDGTKVRYTHAPKDSILPEKGDVVRRGQLLEIVGTTGNSSGPHLHIGEYNGYTTGGNGSSLMLFEAVDPSDPDPLNYTSASVLTCYEPKSGDELYSNNPLR